MQHLKTQWDFPAFKLTVKFLTFLFQLSQNVKRDMFIQSGPIKLNFVYSQKTCRYLVLRCHEVFTINRFTIINTQNSLLVILEWKLA